MRTHGGYKISFVGQAINERRELQHGQDFRLDESKFSPYGLATHPRERDLLRVGMAVYCVDRLARRYRRSPERGLSREVALSVEVSEPDFWNSQRVRSLLNRAVEQVSDDFWDFHFTKGPPTADTLPLFDAEETPRVCLYSGGLDSAGGLASRLRDDKRPLLCVTACHQPGQRSRVMEHVNLVRHHYGARVLNLAAKAAFIKPVPLKAQELSQRLRSFLFLAMGGVAASLVGAQRVEIYENGVGVMNLPAMAGMVVGSRTTKGCHPEFLRLMGELTSDVAERRIVFELPFRFHTKAEMMRCLKADGLEALAFASVSCVHYPLRVKGTAKQCGSCPGCIGRRQALIAAGISEPSGFYRYDLFGRGAAEVPDDQLQDLKAHVMQVANLAELQDDGLKPDLFRRHVFGTHVLGRGEPVAEWVELHRRYRDEWLGLLENERSVGVKWANWLPAEHAVV